MASGHPGAMGYSIRQVEGFIWLYDRRLKHEAARAVQVGQLATKGTPKEINAKVKEWTK